jgi:hypothetical protein
MGRNEPGICVIEDELNLIYCLEKGVFHSIQ